LVGVTLLSNKYEEQQKQITEIQNEHVRLENILDNKLKKILLLSETQKNEFNMIFNEIVVISNF